MLLASSCATPPETYPRHELVDKILKPRRGYTGLTNRWCRVTNAKTWVCETWEVEEYKLEDAGFRETADRLDFVCWIGGKRYKICKDKAGFCRNEYKGFLFKKKIEHFLPVSDYEFLLSANARCFSQHNPSLGK